MCDRLGISAWEVIDAASTKPFGFLPHYPGPGLGGDCIPVVPHFLAWRLREYGYSRAADRRRARGQRARCRSFVLQKVGDALNDVGRPIKGSRILLLGMAYKADVARHARVAEPRGLAPARRPRRRRRATATRGSRRSSSTASRTRSVEWTAEEVARGRLRRDAHPAPRSSSTSRCGIDARLIVDTRNVVPHGPHVRTI